MPNPMKIFVSLPVKDLNKTKEFFSALGFTYNPEFTDENAACMIIGEDSYVMLLVEPFFQSFTKKDIVDASKSVEVSVSLSADSRAKVDELADKALKAGGKFLNEPQEDGFMYSRSFQDLDGHLWGIFYMDPSYIE